MNKTLYLHPAAIPSAMNLTLMRASEDAVVMIASEQEVPAKLESSAQTFLQAGIRIYILDQFNQLSISSVPNLFRTNSCTIIAMETFVDLCSTYTRVVTLKQS